MENDNEGIPVEAAVEGVLNEGNGVLPEVVDDGYLPSSALNIDRDISEVNEIISFVSTCLPANAPNAKGQSCACDNFFTLFCGLALASVTEGFSKMHTEDFLLTAAIKFQDALDNTRTCSYFYDNLFEHLPGKVLPTIFNGYLARKKETPISAEFKKIGWVASATTEKQKSLWFGKVVVETAKEAKKNIVNELNPYYRARA